MVNFVILPPAFPVHCFGQELVRKYLIRGGAGDDTGRIPSSQGKSLTRPQDRVFIYKTNGIMGSYLFLSEFRPPLQCSNIERCTYSLFPQILQKILNYPPGMPFILSVNDSHLAKVVIV